MTKKDHQSVFHETTYISLIKNALVHNCYGEAHSSVKEREQAVSEREQKVKEWEEAQREQAKAHGFYGVAQIEEQKYSHKFKFSGTGEGKIVSSSDSIVDLGMATENRWR